jgi:putative Mn2+ efflux pump MntP
MDAFAGFYLNGYLREARPRYLLYSATVVSMMNTLAAVIGKLIGSQINLLLENFSLPLAIGVLFILGIKMAIKSFKPKFQEMLYELNQKKTLMIYASALSMNAFLLGLAMAAFDITFGIFSLILLAVFFVVPLVGMMTSRKSTKFLLAARLEFFGGIVLIGGSIFYMIKFFELA